MHIYPVKSSYTTDKQGAGLKPALEDHSFLNVLQDKIAVTTKSLGGLPEDSGVPAKALESIGKVGKQSLSNKERALMLAKGQKAVKWLAGRLGIPEGFLNIILRGLGISAEDLVNPETREAAFKAIMKFFDLSEEEQNALLKDFNSFLEGFSGGG